MEDRDEELERLEQELLAQEDDDILEDALLREILTETDGPAFEDPDEILEPVRPMVYCNYSNDYGKDLQEFAESGGDKKMAKKKKGDRLLIGLMITASVLCLGIIGILIYWLEAVLI